LVEKPHEHALVAAQGADEARALDVIILDLQGITAVCDHFVICHGRSTTHLRAVADKIQDSMKAASIPLHHREGRAQGNWLVLDYLDVVVHVFSEETRAFYALERLWGDAPRVEFAAQLAAEPD